jgi:uncharacterized membrane protein
MAPRSVLSLSPVSVLAAAAILAGAPILTATDAEAGLHFCNRTGQTQSVAIGYEQNGQWVSEGWWNIYPGNCATTISYDLPNVYYYFRVKSNGRAWSDEGYYFCTATQAFTIYGDTNCERRGYYRRGFREVHVGDSFDHTVNLTY